MYSINKDTVVEETNIVCGVGGSVGWITGCNDMGYGGDRCGCCVVHVEHSSGCGVRDFWKERKGGGDM